VRATVLNDPALAKQAGRFAWLSINGEEARNAAFVERLAIEGYPTFYVLDGATGAIALRWAGSLTLPELERLLDDGERAVANTGGSPAEAAMARADRLLADGKVAEAAAAYDEALGLAPAGWAGRGRAINARLGALQKTGNLETCAALARRETPGLERGPAFAAAAATGLGCAAEAPADAAWRAGAVAELEPLVEASLGLETVLADDRSSAYGLLVDQRDERGDAPGAKAMAGRWMDFLDAQGKSAASVEARAALDSHRVAAALALGDPARAVPALLASEHDLPADYNPPARLAILYRELGRYDDALAASDRALERAYGARKLRIYDARADTYTRKGDAAAARRTLEEALRYAETLPETQRPRAFLEQLRKKASV
jgi:tetratricopeptide (TPR) repeat protein